MGVLSELDIQPDLVEPTVIPYGEWLPDQPTMNNPGALEALNVVPRDTGTYGPLASFEAAANGALLSTVIGAKAILQSSNIVQLYAGQADGVYLKSGDSNFVKIHSWSVSNEYSWQFIQNGELVILLHREAIPTKIVLGSSTGIAFVGGTPPTAACGAMVGDFLVLGGLLEDPDDGGAEAMHRVRWSGIKNIDAPWVTDPATQADYNDLPAEGGSVVAIAGRTNMTIFQERKISFGRYVNLPQVWDIETVEEDVGCIARDSVVEAGAFTFFIARDGFRAWNGTNSERIGNGKVDKYFFSRLQYAKRHRICGAYDPITNCVYWAFPIGVSGQLNEVIIYSISTNRFTHSIQTLDMLVSSAVSTLTTDDYTGFTDDLGDYVDNPVYLAGGTPLLGAFSEGHLYGTFTGGPMAATIDTGEYSGPDGKRVFVNLATPIVDNSVPNITIQPLWREQIAGGALNAGAVVTQEIDGSCPILAQGRYMWFRTKIPSGAIWKHAQGIAIARKAAGKI